MIQRTAALLAVIVAAVFCAPQGEAMTSDQPPRALETPHFPDRLAAFVWRNWPTTPVARLAATLQTGEPQVLAVAQALGLPSEQHISPLQQQRGYISVIRRNWHLVPEEQILTLLDWERPRLEYTLKEDDFLWVKLGRFKPHCEPLVYSEPTAATWERYRNWGATARRLCPDALQGPQEPRFAFVDALSQPVPAATTNAGDDAVRFIYSYFAVYGDPLLDPALDPYPDGLLARLADVGVNGVWLHTVLRQLAPSVFAPHESAGCETRLATLRALVDRAARYGIKVYLYLNEPRSLPAAAMARHPDLAGAREDGNVALCTSVAAVREDLSNGLSRVFRQVPNLGGVFTITASENLTNCFSRGGEAQCPRCSQRNAADVLTEVHHAIAEGVFRAAPAARVMVWDWGWRGEWAEELIRRLPGGVALLSVSEWSLPLERGGVPVSVGEYSISAVGPGPRALLHWGWARARGLDVMAKVQVNNTWELSAVPYLPTLDLVARHLEGLNRVGVRGLMLSWSLGGYPAPNLKLAHIMSRTPPPSADQALDELARELYGPAASVVRAAWTAFSRAFEQFPFDTNVIYGGPLQVGPANLLHPTPTGFGATMVGFPYDDLETWRGQYPAEVFIAQLDLLAGGWLSGLDALAQVENLPLEPPHREAFEDLRRVAMAAYAHFQSAANQARFIHSRDGDRDPAVLRRVIANEMELARRMADLSRQDSRIGYEASNHYYYYPLDFIEKVVSCDFLLREWAPRLGR